MQLWSPFKDHDRIVQTHILEEQTLMSDSVGLGLWKSLWDQDQGELPYRLP